MLRPAVAHRGWWYLDDDQLEAVLLGLLDGTAWWLGPIVAIGAGALHALAPGHGKTLVGAYLVGGQGRVRDAVGLGVLVAAMHTGTVLAVGAAVHGTNQLAGTGFFESLLRLFSALAVTAVGVALLRRSVCHAAAARTGAGPGHAHGMGGHQHHARDVPREVAPLSRAGIAAIATTGGLLPSPAAVVLLGAAAAVGHTSYGLVLVSSFGLGLAAMLTTVGCAALWGREQLPRRRPDGLVRLAGRLPVLAAVAITLGGLWLGVLAVTLP